MLTLAPVSVIDAKADGGRLSGTAGADWLRGGEGRDVVLGQAGDDQIDGGLGEDVMAGETGDDVYFVDNEGDIVRERAGAGFDHVYASVTVQLSDHVERLTLTGEAARGYGNDGANSLVGNALDNQLNGGGGHDTIIGGEGGDVLFGELGNDRLHGEIGDDVLLGDQGNDLLEGGVGADMLSGGDGADVLYGGLDADLLSGGAGADRFAFRSVAVIAGDRVVDFDADDILDFKAIDAAVGGKANDAFRFIGEAEFSGRAGQPRGP